MLEQFDLTQKTDRMVAADYAEEIMGEPALARIIREYALDPFPKVALLKGYYVFLCHKRLHGSGYLNPTIFAKVNSRADKQGRMCTWFTSENRALIALFHALAELEGSHVG